jgi:hypothetical protein
MHVLRRPLGAIILRVTYDELVEAMRARLGTRIRVTHLDKRGCTIRTNDGVLRPGGGFEEEAKGCDPPIDVTADEHGGVTFRLAPAAYWFRLDPRIVVGVHQERDGMRLRVEMHGGPAFLIETA